MVIMDKILVRLVMVQGIMQLLSLKIKINKLKSKKEIIDGHRT
jgi:hypothetical protein